MATQIEHNDPDTQLALRAGRGDELAMDTLLRSATNAVWYEVRDHCRLVRAEDQEDIHQEILFAIYKSLPGFKGKSLAKSWMISVVHNRIIDHHRKWLRRRKKVEWTSMPEDLDTLERCSVDPDLEFETWDILEHLPHTYRRALELCYKDGLSLQEIADKVGLTYDGARSRLRRATAHVAERTRLWQ